MPFSSRHLYNSISEGEEVGLFYYRDKHGQLRVPQGYGFTNTKSHLIVNEPKAASCSSEVENGKVSPTSLFSICLDFVAKNITLVESLIGFPEIVGKELFNRVQINGGFPRGCHKLLQLFNNAYGSIVLHKLNLRKQFLEVNEIDFLQCFPCLSELDLSHCLLGSDHELLAHIAKVTSLTKLSLKDNCLKDCDLKILTLRLRVMGVGLGNLSFLDLSYNPGISDLSIKHLKIFTKLNTLNLSGTSITMEGVARLVQETKLAFWPKSTDFHNGNEIKTEGWASPVIDDWLSNLKQRLIKRNVGTLNGKTKSFYFKETKRNILKEERKNKTLKYIGASNIFLIAVNEKNNGNMDENMLDISKELGKSGRETSRFSCNFSMLELGSKKAKRKPTSGSCDKESDESDDNMIDLYLKSNISNKKRKLSLTEIDF